LDKGLLVVGGVGVGKTSIMKTIISLIRKCSLNFDKLPVRMYNTLDIVEEFESSSTNSRNDVINKYSKSFRVFDDVKNEREASNYGKVVCLKISYTKDVNVKILELSFYAIMNLNLLMICIKQ
jgi:dephospho-CoA kinase